MSPGESHGCSIVRRESFAGGEMGPSRETLDMQITHACSLGAAVLFMVHGAAHAEMVNLAFDGKGQGQNVKLESTLFNGNVFAGQLRHTVTGGSAFDGSWMTFCTDLAQHVSSSSKPFEVVSLEFLPGTAPMGSDKANAIRDIYAFAGGSQLESDAADALAAAFQLAIWEIILDFDLAEADRGLNIASGNLKATKTDGNALGSAIMGQLTSLFGAIGTVDASGIDMVGFRSGQHQDQLIVVPSPGALALLAGAGLMVRRRRR